MCKLRGLSLAQGVDPFGGDGVIEVGRVVICYFQVMGCGLCWWELRNLGVSGVP